MSAKDGANELLDEQFCREFGFRPFEITPADLDLDSDFLNELEESLQAGYDSTRPIVIAQGREDVQGLICDGKHRAVCIYKLRKKGISISPTIVYRPIKSLDHYRVVKSEYEMRSRSKNSKLAKEIVNRNLSEIIDHRIDEYGDKLPAYLTNTLGCKSVTIVNRLYKQAKQKRSGATPKHRPLNSFSPTANNEPPSNLQPDNWNPFDVAIKTYKTCPHCNERLMVVTDRNGGVTDLKVVEVISK